MTEVWKPVPSLPLEASNLGNIRSPIYGVKAVHKTPSGYRRVGLSVAGKYGTHPVGRLVCAAFHGPCPEGHECDHINRDRSDDRPENLRWLTVEENRARRVQPKGSDHWAAKISEETAVLCLAMPGPNSQIAEALGISARTVRRIKSGGGWKHISSEGPEGANNPPGIA